MAFNEVMLHWDKFLAVFLFGIACGMGFLALWNRRFGARGFCPEHCWGPHDYYCNKDPLA